MTSNSEIPYFAQDEPGKKGILIGNEAIARGLLEAGVVIGSGYPGTPSSDILPALAEMSKTYPHLKLEWSVNEKVGFEVAYAGSMSNLRSVAVMKHVGLNVAADSFMTAAYMGARGGFVVISADDPSQFSSQNEQDNRYYGIHGLVPVFEPASQQEAKDMIKYAFDFSERFKTIVLFRTTTRLNHGRGNISLGDIRNPEVQPEFDWDRNHWVCVPSNTRPQRIQLLNRLKEIQEFADEFPFSSLRLSDLGKNGKTRFGFVASGMAYSTLLDVLSHYELIAEDFADISVLKLGMAYPLPKELMKKLLSNVDYLLVVEELEPIYEQAFKELAYEMGLAKEVDIHGKDIIPQIGELTAEVLLEKVAKIIGKDFKKIEKPDDIVEIPTRFPQLCPGCSHRHTFYALNEVSKKLKIKPVNSTDIGCYTLGHYKPLQVGDTSICMGSSIGLANGFSKFMPKKNPAIAIIGDSTFFHTGIPALINAVYNQNNILVIVLDNSSTAMTGGQDNPGTGILINKEVGAVVKIEEIAKGCGIPDENIWIQESNDLPQFIENMEKAIKAKGVRVFVSKHLCSLIEIRNWTRNNQKIPNVDVDPEKCIGCKLCITTFGCPAIKFDFEAKKALIDHTECRGCEVCIDVCAQDAFFLNNK